MSVAIIDYGSGNLRSAAKAFERTAREAGLAIPIHVTPDPEIVARAERIVLPGVGAFGDCMAGLGALDGMVEALEQAVLRDRRPFLGICVGTQIILDYSQENGGVPCLGLLPGTVERFQTADPFTKIPQMGWNAVAPVCPHPLFAGIEPGSEFYFIHSYYPAPTSPDHVLARTDYADVAFASVVGRDNLAATQFHPERSGRIGLQLLKNFAEWDGVC